MTLQKPLFQQPAVGDAAIEYSGLDVRGGLLSSIFAREGVLDLDSVAPVVRQRAAGANFSVDVVAFRCAVKGDDISDQGMYFCNNTAVENRATPSAPASGTRIHRVVARVRDKLHNGAASTYDWVIEVLEDTGTGTPATPGSAISLGTVSIAAGQVSVTNANITNEPPRAAVGTLARSGDLATTANYAEDVNRPYTWQLNPNGWVQVGGWAKRSGVSFTALGNTFYELCTGVDPAILPPGGQVRDFIAITSKGAVHMVVSAGSANIRFRFNADTIIDQNVFWASFDGTGWRL